MLADVRIPQSLTFSDLDEYLHKGWFRAGRTIFTTNFLHFDGTLYSAIWLRLVLEEFELTRSQQKKIKAANQFSFKIQKFELTDEKEKLYSDYKTGIHFSTAESLRQLLFDYQPFTAFETHEIAVYDAEQLIGLGIFDSGNSATAGIVSFSHPNYKKYSLGTLMILKKILHAKEAGFRYFYPGYFAPGYPAFDYKLNFGKICTEFLDARQNNWVSMAYFKPESSPIQQLYDNLLSAIKYLSSRNQSAELLIYDYYDLNLTLQFNGQQLLNTPLIILVYEDDSFQNEVIIYDVTTGEYKLLNCDVVYYLPNSVTRAGHYNHRILRPRSILSKSDSITELMKMPRFHY